MALLGPWAGANAPMSVPTRSKVYSYARRTSATPSPPRAPFTWRTVPHDGCQSHTMEGNDDQPRPPSCACGTFLHALVLSAQAEAPEMLSKCSHISSTQAHARLPMHRPGCQGL